MVKYHLNPTTGNPGLCRAKRSCPFGGEQEHYSTKELARTLYESRMDIETNGPEAAKARVEENAPFPIDRTFDIVAFELARIDEWEAPWSQKELENLALVDQLAKLSKQEPFTAEQLATMQELTAKLHPEAPAKRNYGISGRSDEDWRRRDKALVGLAETLTAHVEANLATYPEVPALPKSKLRGFEASRLALLKIRNTDFNEIYYTPQVEQYLDSTVNRAAAGQEIELSGTVHDMGVLPPKDRLLYSMREESAEANRLYVALVWPQKELAEALERAQVENVKVGHFENGREWGLTYTVLDPQANERVFSVYEHRNTDSIIINGKTNPEPGEKPYAGESKNDFFAEFSASDRQRAANTLSFFLKEAQSGELPDDTTLAGQASKRDWGAILSKQIPGFAAWHEKTYGPRDPELDDPLKRLDF